MEDNVKYNNSIHNLGRIATAVSVILVLGVPLVACLITGSMPSFALIVAPLVTALLTFGPMTVSEVFSYAPMLGSASYIAFITGNISNLKLPVALSAQDIAGVDSGTPEADAVSTMAIAISSIETIIIVGIGVLFFAQLQPILTSPTFGVMTKYILPALYGGLAVSMLSNGRGKTVTKNKWMLWALPMALIAVAKLIFPNFSSYQSYIMIALIAFTIGWGYLLHKKGMVKVIPREAAKTAVAEEDK